MGVKNPTITTLQAGPNMSFANAETPFRIKESQYKTFHFEQTTGDASTSLATAPYRTSKSGSRFKTMVSLNPKSPQATLPSKKLVIRDGLAKKQPDSYYRTSAKFAKRARQVRAKVPSNAVSANIQAFAGLVGENRAATSLNVKGMFQRKTPMGRNTGFF